MIFEVIEWIRQQCVASGVSVAYQDLISSETLQNVCAVRSLPDSVITNSMGCGKDYTVQTFSVLYRGNTDRKANIEVMDAIFRSLHKKVVTLANTKIVISLAERPSFVFEDSKGIAHYNLNVQITYN